MTRGSMESPVRYASRTSSIGLDGAVKIGKQIFFILNADRNSHQVFWQIALRQQFRWNAGV